MKVDVLGEEVYHVKDLNKDGSVDPMDIGELVAKHWDWVGIFYKEEDDVFRFNKDQYRYLVVVKYNITLHEVLNPLKLVKG